MQAGADYVIDCPHVVVDQGIYGGKIQGSDSYAGYKTQPPGLWPESSLFIDQGKTDRYHSRFFGYFLLESNMYAVIKTGGKQYRVSAGEKIKIEQIPADVGAEISLDQVLMVGEGESVKIGTPVLAGASVTAKVISQGRHPKVKIFKMRRRKHYQKHQGHRQNYTELEISGITI
jgi:large subunit ribosomal protein L21